jgi:hypothetical protein
MSSSTWLFYVIFVPCKQHNKLQWNLVFSIAHNDSYKVKFVSALISRNFIRSWNGSLPGCSSALIITTLNVYKIGISVRLCKFSFSWNALIPLRHAYLHEHKRKDLISRSWYCWTMWTRGLRRRSAAARLLRLWVRIPLGAWMFVVSFVCCQVMVSATSWSIVQGVLPTVGCHCVWCRNLVNEEAPAHRGLLYQKNKKGRLFDACLHFLRFAIYVYLSFSAHEWQLHVDRTVAH